MDPLTPAENNDKTGWFGTVKNFVELDNDVILRKLIQWESKLFSKDSRPQQISAWKNSMKILQDSFKNLISIISDCVS